MAYPVIDDIARVQVRMQKSSGLPEDVMINTWYFQTSVGQTLAQDAQEIANMLDAFYGGTFGTNAGSIADMISTNIVSARYVFYDLGEAPPRYPVTPDGAGSDYIDATWAAGGGTPYFPEEVALCLSYRGVQAGPRRRGRVYLGPFHADAGGASAGNTRPTGETMSRIADAAIDLLNSAEDPVWVGVSPTDGVFYQVESGWVDNAWDTQRSRGAAPTARTTWDTSGQGSS